MRSRIALYTSLTSARGLGSARSEIAASTSGMAFVPISFLTIRLGRGWQSPAPAAG